MFVSSGVPEHEKGRTGALFVAHSAVGWPQSAVEVSVGCYAPTSHQFVSKARVVKSGVRKNKPRQITGVRQQSDRALGAVFFPCYLSEQRIVVKTDTVNITSC